MSKLKQTQLPVKHWTRDRAKSFREETGREPSEQELLELTAQPGGSDQGAQNMENNNMEDLNGKAGGGVTNEELLKHILNFNEKMDSFNLQLNNPVSGIIPKVNAISEQADDSTDRINRLEKENAALRADMQVMRDDMRVMGGLVHRMSVQIDNMKGKIDDQKQRSMSDNVIIHNYKYSVPQGVTDLKPVVETFLKEEMSMEIKPREIYRAHKHGDNTIVAKVACPLKQEIFANKSNLNGKKNPDTNNDIFITDQQPDRFRSARKDAYAKADEYKAINVKLAAAGQPQAKVEVKRDKLFVNSKLITNPVPAPKPADVLGIKEDEMKRMENIKFVQTDTQGEKGSSFRGVYTKVTNITEVRRSYVKMKRDYPAATHIMLAYAYKKSNADDDLEYGKQDDGEWGGSFKILETIKEKKLSNVAVFVIRQHGGVDIGGKRFMHIKDSAVNVLKKAGLITN